MPSGLELPSDTQQLLNFFKMSFYLFSVCSFFAVTILMPINWKVCRPLRLPDHTLSLWQSNVGLSEGDDANDWPDYAPSNGTAPGREWLDLISDANSYLTVHLLFTYLFTLLALRFTYKNYRRFIRARQLFTLELVHSISARTVMVTNLPNHLQSERALAEYFENMELTVESVSVCREVGTLKAFLDKRTDALLKLEKEWVKYVGNPSSVENYDPSDNAVPADGGEPNALEGQPGRLVVPHRKRPTLRPGWFKPKVDALEYLEAKFKEADEKVKKWRKHGKFKSSHCAFVTFEKMSSAVRLGLLQLRPPYSNFRLLTANRNPNSACLPTIPMRYLPSPGTARHSLG
jgi:calcium permeable stress-gated cation channel